MFLQLKLEAIYETTSSQCGVYYFAAPTEQDEFKMHPTEANFIKEQVINQIKNLMANPRNFSRRGFISAMSGSTLAAGIEATIHSNLSWTGPGRN
ncbi:MAG: hypothetical protein ABI760_25105 [Ferruginibacter sp.]